MPCPLRRKIERKRMRKRKTEGVADLFAEISLQKMSRTDHSIRRKEETEMLKSI
jgi:hypothetical protein